MDKVFVVLTKDSHGISDESVQAAATACRADGGLMSDLVLVRLYIGEKLKLSDVTVKNSYVEHPASSESINLIRPAHSTVKLSHLVKGA